MFKLPPWESFWPRLLLSAAIMRQESASDPALLSTGLGKDLDKEPAMYDQYAITVPFGRSTARCKCESEAWSERPSGCKDCAPVSTLAKLKSEAIKQTKRRWVWFLAAQKLDDELNTRLGTPGYLPLEIRLNIFRHVLENYIEEALTYHIFHDPFGYHHFNYYRYEHPVSKEDHNYPSFLEWQAIITVRISFRNVPSRSSRKTALMNPSTQSSMISSACTHTTGIGKNRPLPWTSAFLPMI